MLFRNVMCHLQKGYSKLISGDKSCLVYGWDEFLLSRVRNNLMEKKGNRGKLHIVCQYCFVVQSETSHPSGSDCSFRNDTSTINIAGSFSVLWCFCPLELPRPFQCIGLKFSLLVFEEDTSWGESLARSGQLYKPQHLAEVFWGLLLGFWGFLYQFQQGSQNGNVHEELITDTVFWVSIRDTVRNMKSLTKCWNYNIRNWKESIKETIWIIAWSCDFIVIFEVMYDVLLYTVFSRLPLLSFLLLPVTFICCMKCIFF